MMRLIIIAALVSIILISNRAMAEIPKYYVDAKISERVAECVSHFGPDISELNEEALKYARIKPDDLTRWKKNIKVSALLPRLQFGYERRTTDSFDLNLDDNVSVTASGSVIGPSTSEWGQGQNSNNNVEVTAVWYLDELLFNRDELSISSDARQQASARRELLGEMTDAYYDLKRLLSIYFSKGVPNTGRIIMDINRLSGKLNAFTGGYFGRRFNLKGVKCE